MKRTRQEKLRLGFLSFAVVLFFVIVVARLVHLQVFLSPRYQAIVDKQSRGSIKIPAPRGMIYDRNGRILSSNITRYSLYAYPLDKKQLKAATSYLEEVLHLANGTARKEYGLATKKFRWIKRRIDDRLATKIEDSAPSGLYLRKETQREYPFGLIGKQILGFTDIDGHGQSGIELSCDSMLSGIQGLADIRRDGKRNLYPVNETAIIKPVSGKSLVLTLDWRLQEIFEEELREGVKKFNAQLGMGAFVDCRTGEVLAMAHYDPSDKRPNKPVKVCTVTDQFEPGSIFKVFTAAGLLDEGLVDFSDSTFCEEGYWKMDRGRLRDDKELGWLNFRSIMELSSNIGVGKYAAELGGDKLYETARRFGFGQSMHTGLAGETRGSIFCPDKWSDYTIASLSIGHAVAVNCLQVAMGFAAIANRGELLQPQLVYCSIDDEGDIHDTFKRTVIRQAMKETSADSLIAILRGVVERGTATLVNSEAVAIAGKTGTAEIPDLVNHRYFKNKFNASFAGFFPADNPIVAGVIVLKAPEPIHYGGHTSGPIFRNVAERYMILNPDLFASNQRVLTQDESKQTSTVIVPDLLGREIEYANSLALERGLELRTTNDSGMVLWQYPSPDRLLFEHDEILIAVAEMSEDPITMPDLRGLSIRQASAFLQFAGIRSRVQGSGLVRRQSIAPGTTITENNECRLECRPI